MNICIRCGKERIVASTYEEVVSKSTVTYSVMICPDPDCQKLVDVTLKNDATKREMIRDEHAKRDLRRQAAKKAAAS